MSIEDAYARAIASHNLRVGSAAGDVDIIIAAGWVRDSLACKVYRTRQEFQMAREIMDFADDELRRMASVYKDLEVAIQREVPVDDTEEAHARHAERLRALETERKRLEANKLARDRATRLQVYSCLKTLPEARETLTDFVAGQAALRRVPDFIAERSAQIADHVLDYFVDVKCPRCQGLALRTVIVAGKKPIQLACQACKGSGMRKLRFEPGTRHREVEFVEFLLTRLEAKLERVNTLMRKFLRERSTQT